MRTISSGRLAFMVVGAAALLAGWLLLRPDRAGAQWTDGTAFALWLGVEAAAAVVIGVLGRDGSSVAVAVGAGWALQMLHFAVLGEHYDDPLWGVGLELQVLFGAVAVGLALVSRRLSRLSRVQHR